MVYTERNTKGPDLIDAVTSAPGLVFASSMERKVFVDFGNPPQRGAFVGAK
jgi:hypothetical protein